MSGGPSPLTKVYDYRPGLGAGIYPCVLLSLQIQTWLDYTRVRSGFTTNTSIIIG